MNHKADLQRAEQEANKILAGDKYQIPINVGKICDDLGIKLYWTKEQGVSGRLNRIENCIYVNSADNNYRKKFTIAHELGHYLLHKDDDILHRYSGYSLDPKELEANHFAASLIMPEKDFCQAWEMFNYDITKVAVLFNVSRAAAAFRVDYITGSVNEFQ